MIPRSVELGCVVFALLLCAVASRYGWSASARRPAVAPAPDAPPAPAAWPTTATAITSPTPSSATPSAREASPPDPLPEGGQLPEGQLPEGQLDEGQLVLTAERPVMNLGVDVQTTLTITLPGKDLSLAFPGRVRASVGTVSDIAPLPEHPETFFATYRPPPDMRPQAAMIFVEMVLPDGARPHAVARLQLQAPTRFPLHTSPSAQVTIEIRGRVFGPVTADELGQVLVPILVPPGVAIGVARAVNQFGVAKETSVDLQSLDYPRILLLSDPQGEVGTEFVAEVWAIEPTGEFASPEDMDLGVSTGKVRRIAGALGVARFLVSLPHAIGSGKMSLVASMNDGSSTDVAALALLPGKPVELTMHAEPPVLEIGSERHASVRITARDSFGNAVEPRGVTTLIDDVAVPAQIAPDMAVIYVPAPAAWRNRDRLVVRADLGHLHAAAAISLKGGNPVHGRLTAERSIVQGTGSDRTEVRLRILDANGVPTSATHVAWRSSGAGEMTAIPSSNPGDYRAEFSVRHTIRDTQTTIIATVDDRFSSTLPVSVHGVPARTFTARMGLITNGVTTLGPSLFVEATWPLRIPAMATERLTRIVGLGFSVGYVSTEVTTPGADLGVRLRLNQLPLLGVARFRVPLGLPAELFVSGMAGMTFASLSISAHQGMGALVAKATARGVTVGLGAEASLPLDPGQLVVGARYLAAELGDTSAHDRVEGNSLGFIGDLGFRLGF
jgi:hypothetical protein